MCVYREAELSLVVDVDLWRVLPGQCSILPIDCAVAVWLVLVANYHSSIAGSAVIIYAILLSMSWLIWFNLKLIIFAVQFFLVFAMLRLQFIASCN